MTNIPLDPSWTPHATELLERACDHYGGIETWRALRLIRLFPERFSGAIPWLKGIGHTFHIPAAFEVMPRERRVRFLEYPDRDHIGIFEDGLVRLERRDGGEVVAESVDHRRSFLGLAKYRRWAPIDALYFFGYALAHYHSLPFTLGEARLLGTREAGSRSNPLNALDLELPADLHTHCRRQSFYFDKAGMLVRHDYHAEVVGFWARGAHFWKRQRSFNGFPIAMERHVLASFGTITCPLTALHASFRDAEVELDAPGSA